MLVDFDAAHREKTFRISDDDFPFGFEYISRTSFREINLGEPHPSADTVTLSGRKYQSQGFRVCSGCGKVMTGDSKKDHMINCRWRDKPDQAKALDVLYLYREFESEAIRFLMPDDQFWTDKGLHSFIASLQLGLKEKFGGQVGHLQITACEEPQANSTLRKSFLYLFDSVPGGTGYLRQLIRDPNELKSIFDAALEVVRACDCSDGCYRCLFAYRNSFNQDKTSRKRATDLLAAIAKHWPQLGETSQGLSAIRLNSNFESELERRFIEAIRRYRPNNDPSALILRKEIFHGKAGYYLKIGDSAWTIETQVSLGPSDGVDIPCRADFVIKPATSKILSKPIVVFTDGWEYHKIRLWEDFQQRLAILRSNQYLCWSLTWNDIAHQLDPDQAFDWLDGLNCNLNPQFQSQRQSAYEQYKCQPLLPFENHRSFNWLMQYLLNPDESSWTNWGLLRTMAQAAPQSFTDQTIQQQWLETATPMIGEIALTTWNLPAQFIAGTVEVSESLTVHHATDLHRHQSCDPEGSIVIIYINETQSPDSSQLKKNWNEALRLFNFYQFLPHLYAITNSAILSGQQPLLANPCIAAQPITPLPKQDSQWQTVRELCSEDLLLPIIEQMQQDDWPIPDIGFELEGDRGQVLAEAEIAWPHSKVAIILYPEEESIFSSMGWFAIAAESCLTNINRLKEKL